MCLALAAITCLSGTANAQFRLDQFTNTDPTEAVLQLADGSVVWAMTVEDSTFIWKGDANGSPQWARTIIDPGSELQLVEGANSSIIIVEAYLPSTDDTNMTEALVTQTWRTSMISEQGTLLWSKRGSITYEMPYGTTVLNVELRSTPASDGGLFFTLMNPSGFFPTGHLVRVGANGALSWCKKVGTVLPGGHLALSYSSNPWDGLRLVELPVGDIALVLDSQDPPWDIDIYTVDAQGTPAQARKLDYTGAIIYRRAQALAVSASGNLLIGGRMSTSQSANVFTYELDADLELFDGDIYWDFNPNASPELRDIAIRNDGQRTVQVSSATSSYPYTFLMELEDDGQILQVVSSGQLPFTSGQTLTVEPKDILYTDNGILLAHSLRLTHPVLGNLGNFIERTAIDPSDPGCYFSSATVQHIQVPDSLVSMLPLDNYMALDAIPVMSDESPLTEHSLIGTLQGCLFQTGIAELPSTASFQLASNIIAVGSDIVVRTDGPMELWVTDASGRVVVERVRISASGQWQVPIPALTSGMYSAVGQGTDHRLSTQRLVIH